MQTTASLPSLIDRASKALLRARSSAEVLEARDIASAAYSIAKTASRIAKAKNAHDTLIAAAHRAQADALEIEAGAKRRLADEYDAAQERGEVSGHGGNHKVSNANLEDIGLTKIEIHEARRLRDAEKRDPGVIRREERGRHFPGSTVFPDACFDFTNFAILARLFFPRAPHGSFTDADLFGDETDCLLPVECPHDANSLSNALASFRSRVSKPSVNRP